MYHYDGIVLALKDALRSKPARHLGHIAQQLQVNRRTLTRALKSKGLDFSHLRAELIVQSARTLLLSRPPLSRKEIAHLLGFPSLGAFSHFLKRHSVKRGLVGLKGGRTMLPSGTTSKRSLKEARKEAVKVN